MAVGAHLSENHPEAASPWLAFAFLLALLIGGCMAVQLLGYWLGIALARYALWISLPPALWLTYGHFFPLTRRSALIGAGMALLLVGLGYLSAGWWDMSWDGMAYQQPAVDALLNGWNPLNERALMLWQNIYPSGAWGVEASVAALSNSIEAAKMLNIWWLVIALPVLLRGLAVHKGALTRKDQLLACLMALSPVFLSQMLTHYVDGMIYQAGLAFLGALLMLAGSLRERQAAYALMAVSILFIVNAKLSGIYHAVMLCAMAVVFLWLRTRRFPCRATAILFVTGLAAVLLFGFRPYVTNLMEYGSLLHTDAQSFSGSQRPANLADMPAPQKFLYSLFSATGGEGANDPAQLKWPWQVGEKEWALTGVPDIRTGGFGPLFALGLVLALMSAAYALARREPPDRLLLWLAFGCFASSALFPEGWWARYVPFAYAAPLLLLLALPPAAATRLTALAVLAFLLNSAAAGYFSYAFFHRLNARFAAMADTLRAQQPASVYLVPPGSDYEIYSHSYITLQRRLHLLGIDTTVKVDAECTHKAADWAGFEICYQ